MRTIYAVIGANYGDEGKGLFTDFLARNNDADRIVRFNGGAQAGHTVIDSPHGRHVFSTYGSGSFSDLGTTYTPEVIVNPFAIQSEAAVLSKLGVCRRIHLTKLSPMTTQYEILVNQLVEDARGDQRHGSCGWGINETVERHNAMLAVDPMLPQMLHNPTECDVALNWIHDTWLPKRLADLGIPDAVEAARARAKVLRFDANFKAFYSDMKFNCLAIDSSVEIAAGRLDVQYEGAQGLAIDEELGVFPYVTRSITGLPNILKDIKRRLAASKTPDEHIKLKVVYASRTYLTRHGRGPLPFEASVREVLNNGYEDTTNVTNKWQEHLRYAPLDLSALSKRITADLIRCQQDMVGLRNNVELLPYVGLTHMDVAETFPVITQHGRERLTPTELIGKLTNEHGLKVALASYGPTNQDVRVLQQNFIHEEG